MLEGEEEEEEEEREEEEEKGETMLMNHSAGTSSF